MAEKGKVALAGIDIGNSSIVAVVAPGPAYIPAGVGIHPTVGMRKGSISDADGVARCIRDALEKAENAAGVKVSGARVGFTGYTAEFTLCRARILAGKERRVNKEDLERLQRLAAVEDLPAGRRILKIIPVEYIADKTPGIRKPLGIHFKSLEMEARLLTVDNKYIDQLAEVLHRANIKVLDFIPSTIAAAAGVLKSAEMQLGTALLDFGAGTTGVLLCNHGFQIGFDVIPVGGDLISSDLAVGLRTTLEAAGEVKKQIGVTGCPDCKSIEVPGINNSGTHVISADFAKEIIEARVSEILEMVKNKIRIYTGENILPGGLVITGGGAAMRGMTDYIANYLGMPVRMASPSLPDGQGDTGQFLSCSAAIGLLNPVEKGERSGILEPRREGIWKKFKEAFRLPN